MADLVTRDKYPHAAEYVASLPAGLGSYPSARIKASLLRMLLADHLRAFDESALPSELIELSRNPPPPTAWVEETKMVTLMLAVRDEVYSSDEEWVRWCKGNNASLFRSPLYRLLMYVATPEMALKGGAQRWSQFHQGTTLRTMRLEPRRYAILLGFPPRLFAPLYVKGLASAFEAAIEAAGAKGVRSSPPEIEDARARVELTWI